MMDALEPLTVLPGVQFVMLATGDGVPIAVPGHDLTDNGEDVDPEAPPAFQADVLAAVAADWIEETARAVAPLGWHPPERVALRAARGTLVLRRAGEAVLVVLLGDGLRPEDVFLAMDGTVARIQRLLRDMGPGGDSRRNENEGGEPAGPLPARSDRSDREAAR
jgi:predicted regulator of Ras-like GTPase activity (Roadblock/LC7/MglB family)